MTGIYIIEVDNFDLLLEALKLIGAPGRKVAQAGFGSWAVKLSEEKVADIARYVGKIGRYNQEKDDPHKIIYGRLN